MFKNASPQMSQSPKKISHVKQVTIEDIEMKKLLQSERISKLDLAKPKQDSNALKPTTSVTKSQSQAKEQRPSTKETAPVIEEPKQRTCFHLQRRVLITAFCESERDFPSIASIHPGSHRTSK